MSIFMKKRNEINFILIEKKRFQKEEKEEEWEWKPKERKEREKEKERGKGGKKEWTFLIVRSAPAFNNASTHSICPL